MQRILLFWALALVVPLMAQAKVTAWVSHNPVSLGETFELFVEAEGLPDDAEPDVSRLGPFDVLSQSVQSNTTIVNTSVTQSRRWTFTLLPKQAGKMALPPIRVGPEESQAIPLEVRNQPRSGKGEDQVVWLEGELSKEEVYPGEEVDYVVRIFRTVDASNESLSSFNPQNADLERYDQQTAVQVVKGQRVKVTELRYAIFPQQPGELVVPGLRYQGDIPDGRQRDPFDPFKLMRRGGKRIYRELPPQTVKVWERPPEVKGWWLPARDLKITSSWAPDPPTFRVGEPATWTLQLQALGVRPGQLPELQPQLPDGLKSYPEQPQLDTFREPEGVKAYRTQAMALIPSKPGTLTIPEQRVAWWDVQTHQLRETVVPAQTVTVLPGAEDAAPPVPSNRPAVAEPQAALQTEAPVAGAGAENLTLWQVATGALAVGWGLTLLAWWGTRRRRTGAGLEPETENPSEQAAWKRLQEAEEHPPRFRNALREWIASRWPEEPATLETLGRHCPEAREALQALEAACYGMQSNGWDRKALLLQLKRLRESTSSASAAPALPELYA